MAVNPLNRVDLAAWVFNFFVVKKTYNNVYVGRSRSICGGLNDINAHWFFIYLFFWKQLFIFLILLFFLNENY